MIMEQFIDEYERWLIYDRTIHYFKTLGESS